jgi:hypothetical protein
MPAEEALLHRKHVHGAALALGITAAAAGELRHDAFGVHVASEHVAVIAIAGDDLVAGLDRHLHADHHRLLADIEVAEAADQPHAVELAGLLLEAADQQHVAVGRKLLVLVEFRHRGGSVRRLTRGCAAGRLGRLFVAGNGHFSPRRLGSAGTRQMFPNSRNPRRAEAREAASGSVIRQENGQAAAVRQERWT